MTIEELKDKHFYISHQHKESHTKLSIQFAIEVLEAHLNYKGKKNVYEFGWNKIQELKQYLDAKV